MRAARVVIQHQNKVIRVMRVSKTSIGICLLTAALGILHSLSALVALPPVAAEVLVEKVKTSPNQIAALSTASKHLYQLNYKINLIALFLFSIIFILLLFCIIWSSFIKTDDGEDTPLS
jgi:hypothetical protein